jgi:hypothetical protein
MQITKELVTKINKLLDEGLVCGLGKPIPGKMCVEALICYALDLPHGDEPNCVSPAIRSLKIKLNDSNWSSNKARAEGMRNLAILQLGTNNNFSDVGFTHKVAMFTCCEFLPSFLRDIDKEKKWFTEELKSGLRSAKTLEEAKNAADAAAYAAANTAAYAATYAAYTATYAAADAAADAAANAAYAADAADTAAYAAANAANAAYAADAAAYAADDKYLIMFAKGIEKILIEMNVPGKDFIQPNLA